MPAGNEAFMRFEMHQQATSEAIDGTVGSGLCANRLFFTKDSLIPSRPPGM